MSGDGSRPQSHGRSISSFSNSSIPSIQTAHFGAAGAGASCAPVGVGAGAGVDGRDERVGISDGNEEDEEVVTEEMAPVSTDHERQILLLMLLAQVCALHDPTPRTFTVHVLELFERGILDRESIHFLFELGLVPPSPAVLPSRGLLLTDGDDAPATAPTWDTTAVAASASGDAPLPPSGGPATALSTDVVDRWLEESPVSPSCTGGDVEADAANAVAVTTPAAAAAAAAELTMTTTARPRHPRGEAFQQTIRSLRSLEATAIRRQLSAHDVEAAETKLSSQRRGAPETAGCDSHAEEDEGGTTGTGGSGNRNSNRNTAASSGNNCKPWDVEHFPLSLSRYQREFKQIRMLNAGSFGQVFHAIRDLDGCEYAIKKVTFDAKGYSNESIQRVIREVQCLATVNDHPNIVRYYTSWLEPSWMTGSGSGGNSSSRIRDGSAQQQRQQHILQIEANPNAPEQKLLRDLHNLMQQPRMADDDDEEGGEEGSSFTRSFGKVESSSIFSSESTSTWGRFLSGDRQREHPSQQRRQRQRRPSLDSSVQSIDESYRSRSLQHWGGAHDDSWLSSTRERKRSLKKGTQASAAAASPAPTRSSSSSYRYQIILYIQMQLCHPATLSDWIRERNRSIDHTDHVRRIGPALEIFHQIVSGLAHVHAQKIIHRDLKPANIFASADGKVIKIGDFGLSKQLHDIANSHATDGTAFGADKSSKAPTQAKHTKLKSPNQNHHEAATHHDARPHQEYWLDPKNRAVVPTVETPSQALVEYKGLVVNEPLTAGIGTASYAAPEQVRSKDYGTAVDIFSLGLIMLELVCSFGTEHERLDHFQKCRNQRIPQWIQDHYPDIASTVLACTRPNACDRPTATQLADISKVKSPRASLEVNLLRRQLREKEEELAEKNKTIEDMQREMERMKASMLSISGLSSGITTLTPSIADVGNFLLEDATTFDEDV